ncbi:hypothetical protein DFAR_2210013 [Desulfarculales bacterium]
MLDSQGGLTLSGLINAHTHGAITIFRALADDVSLKVWLHQHIFPTEALWVASEKVKLCTLLAAGEMLVSGSTTVCDVYFYGSRVQSLYQGRHARCCLPGRLGLPGPGHPRPGGQNGGLPRLFGDLAGARHSDHTGAFRPLLLHPRAGNPVRDQPPGRRAGSALVHLRSRNGPEDHHPALLVRRRTPFPPSIWPTWASWKASRPWRTESGWLPRKRRS